MICPKCKRRYRENTFVCSKCHSALVMEASGSGERTSRPASSDISMVKVYETWDSYDFLEASKALKDAGVSFSGDEWYSGEFRPSKRAQAPYLWTLLVPVQEKEKALQVLDEKMCGKEISFVPSQEEPANAKQRTICFAIVVAVIIFWMISILYKALQ